MFVYLRNIETFISRHNNYENKLSNEISEQERGMRMELGDYTTYPMKGPGSISFQMTSSDVI